MAWIDCVITVKGDGAGRYGRPKADRTGPLRSFLVFNQVFFKTVRDHLAQCGKCDPDEAIRTYLDRLRRPPTAGVRRTASTTVTGGFERLEKLLAKAGRPVSQPLLNEAYLMSGDPDFIIKYAPSCTLMELVQCYRHHEASTSGSRMLERLCGQDRTFAVLQSILKGGGQAPSEEDLRKLLDVAEVMLS